MKYFIAFSCIIAYVAATDVILEATDPKYCACIVSLQNAYKDINSQNKALIDLGDQLTDLNTKVDEIDTSILEQNYALICLLDATNYFNGIENNTSTNLNQQTVVLKEIYSDLCEMCEVIEELEDVAEAEFCLLESLRDVAVVALEDCTGTCTGQIGAKA